MTKNRQYITTIAIITLMISCTEKQAEHISSGELLEKKDTSIVVNIIESMDTLNTLSKEAVQFIVNPNIKVQNWHDSDFVISCESDYYKNELVHDAGYYREEWSNVKSPIIATYKGNDFGDYFHINFVDVEDNIYDFGFGNNNFGQYQLFEDGEGYADNPTYLNQKFKVHWQWVVSDFPCCSGEYYHAKAYMPSIVKLELIQE